MERKKKGEKKKKKGKEKQKICVSERFMRGGTAKGGKRERMRATKRE